MDPQGWLRAPYSPGPSSQTNVFSAGLSLSSWGAEIISGGTARQKRGRPDAGTPGGGARGGGPGGGEDEEEKEEEEEEARKKKQNLHTG